MKNGHFDVIIVGAGQAGTAAAFDLATAGLRTLLLDKAAFPRVKACAGGVTTKALALYRFSIAPVIRRRTASMLISYKQRSEVLSQSRGTVCALTIRAELDDYCLQKALEQGAEFLQIRGLQQIEQTPDGVELRTRCGHAFSADVLIGADGAHSQVRALSGELELPRTAVALEAQVSLNDLERLPEFTFDFGEVKHGYGWLFPKHDHVNVGIYTARPQDAAFSKQILRDYAARRLGTSRLHHYLGFPIATGGTHYRPTNDRVLLVGDAAGWADPLLGEGIHNAIKSGQAAAAAIVEARAANASVAERYRRLAEPVRKDAENCAKAARFVYSTLPFSYQLVRRYPLRPAVINGFAAGMTITECKHQAQRFAVNPPPIHPPSILDPQTSAD